MKKVQRWRYYCDFCKKSGGSGAAMLAHESSCTLNPDRSCRLCVLTNGGSAATMDELLAVLPDPALHMMPGWSPNPHATPAAEVLNNEEFLPLIEAAMPQLRELTQNCPACIMAALRCKKIPVPMVESFKFTEEFASAMSQANDNRREDGYY